MGNSYLKLPIVFDPLLLEKDLAVCEERSWVRHFNQADFSGNWQSISLRSLSGREDDIYSHPGIYQDTPLLKKCEYFDYIQNLFHCNKESVRLLSLAPMGKIKEHRDHKLGYEYGVFRVHIPVKTGPKVSFWVDGFDIAMNTGEAWYANFNLPHSVTNYGDTSRVHLIIDCIRNEWSDDLFSKAGYDFEEKNKSKAYDEETTKKIIAELEKMEGDAARKLISNLNNNTVK